MIVNVSKFQVDGGKTGAGRVAEDPPTAAKQAAEDVDLVKRFLEGDVTAFEEIMNRYRRMIYNLALKMVENHDDADEVTQKTFISSYKNLGGFEGRSSLKTWLFRIAMNYSKNLIRDRGRRQGDEVNEHIAAPDADIGGRLDMEEKRKVLAQAVKTLPPRQKDVLQLRVQQELSFAQIADIVGCSVSAAKVNYHYAVKTLRTRIPETKL
jgi:RNA polymerase sigma-70 factor, ECF subfamily